MSGQASFDYAVIGGGILGLATARELLTRHPAASVVVLEKEPALARHQTGHNSGVIHAGVYYNPGSMKATLGVAGRDSMEAFCREHQLPHEICGKVIVATEDSERAALEELHRRSVANGVQVRLLDADGVRELEPHVRCVAGLHSPNTGITDFVAVAHKLGELVERAGGQIRLSAPVTRINVKHDGVRLIAGEEELIAEFVINCGGLQSDRLARMAGAKPKLRIVPFRGEYYSLKSPAAELVRTLIYPVPDPDFPFLGVHLTRGIDGHVHAGPNAVLAASREGYSKRDFRARDFADSLGYRGFWRLAGRHPREGAGEMWRSASKKAFVKRMQRLMPEVTVDDVEPGGSGVRAQALMPDGRLADDFVIITHGPTINVCNAPSPAATASLEIAKRIVAHAERAWRTDP
ncbi:MAG: L-2-hydroxyglutarate oxidase [Thermoleophilaceae bacterium]|nr:L-2-hydroxyglutarate oxidase [Thermoleophilaceae bacterium]